MVDGPVSDPYSVLGVRRDASPLQVARAHRQLAKRYHPDLHPGEDMTGPMRRVNAAYRLLSSPEHRAEYDRLHPAAGTTAAGHWASNRRPIRPAQPTSSRTWATWRTSADEVRAAPATRRDPNEVRVHVARRPQPRAPGKPAFRDTGWAALLAGAVFLAILLAAIAIGRLV